MAMKAAAKIVDALLESDEVDPKAFAQSRDQQIGEYKPIVMHGSYGSLKADPYDGTVIRYEDAPDYGDEDYKDIVKFDLDEFRRWLQQNAPEFAHIVVPGEEFDIVDVGFWLASGEYVAAEAEHRAVVYLGAEP
jgi:hypothetical protein